VAITSLPLHAISVAESVKTPTSRVDADLRIPASGGSGEMGRLLPGMRRCKKHVVK
jgi:hypothetical protein